ncbi:MULTISPECIES: hypothetical protein [unclassified Methylophaga]|uniref:hypothetical protein n=1 Tax=unclassified Methylophaga TaxID=2629249 RepID=UPI000C9260B9|nr:MULTISPECIES: hypothetical protein [unclassified Methylophaga]MBN46321.1 hypothetical protein [Methylophaga sp.]|tara:strand:+ start:63494 stop:63706 length:213 start_codon:yes stop_codon:yes gene_type:complete
MKFIMAGQLALSMLSTAMGDRRFRIFEKAPLIKASPKNNGIKSANTLSQKGRRKRQRQQRSQSYKKGGVK